LVPAEKGDEVDDVPEIPHIGVRFEDETLDDDLKKCFDSKVDVANNLQ
jgi:hypothetical protein